MSTYCNIKSDNKGSFKPISDMHEKSNAQNLLNTKQDTFRIITEKLNSVHVCIYKLKVP